MWFYFYHNSENFARETYMYLLSESQSFSCKHSLKQIKKYKFRTREYVHVVHNVLMFLSMMNENNTHV